VWGGREFGCRDDPEARSGFRNPDVHEEGAFYYSRPALPEYLAGEKALRGFTLHDGAWYEKNRIDVHLSTEIVRIDPGARTVATKEGPLLTIGFFWRRAARPRDRTSRAPMHRVSPR